MRTRGGMASEGSYDEEDSTTTEGSGGLGLCQPHGKILPVTKKLGGHIWKVDSHSTRLYGGWE